ncbi:MAG: hypothetical protein ACR2GA_04990 [Chloroflexota bacterium]
MMLNTHLSRTLLAAALAAALGTPLAVHAAQSTHESARHTHVTSVSPVYTFGIKGGNIRPWQATINADGSITGSDSRVPGTRLAYAPDTLRALRKLQRAEHFGSLKSQVSCSHSLPDIASQFITTYGSSGRTVTVHGACVGNFEQLYAALYAVAHVQ